MRKNKNIKRFNIVDDNKIKVNISIGDYYASREPTVLSTLLGSCVSACLYDWKNKVGGMNHILLPGKADFEKYGKTARYSINAMELLINAMMKLGAEKRRIVAKVFGGANVISGISGEYSVGPKISEFVLNFLKTESIHITGQDLGGEKSRKLFFHTDTGEVFLRRSSSLYHSYYKELEKKKIEEIRKKLDRKTDITLF